MIWDILNIHKSHPSKSFHFLYVSLFRYSNLNIYAFLYCFYNLCLIAQVSFQNIRFSYRCVFIFKYLDFCENETMSHPCKPSLSFSLSCVCCRFLMVYFDSTLSRFQVELEHNDVKSNHNVSFVNVKSNHNVSFVNVKSNHNVSFVNVKSNHNVSFVNVKSNHNVSFVNVKSNHNVSFVNVKYLKYFCIIEASRANLEQTLSNTQSIFFQTYPWKCRIMVSFNFRFVSIYIIMPLPLLGDVSPQDINHHLWMYTKPKKIRVQGNDPKCKMPFLGLWDFQLLFRNIYLDYEKGSAVCMPN